MLNQKVKNLMFKFYLISVTISITCKDIDYNAPAVAVFSRTILSNKLFSNTNFSKTSLFSDAVVQKRMQVQFAALVVFDHQTNQQLLF